MTAKNGQTLRMRVDGMTCAGCEAHVAQALERAGATGARADFRRAEATFSVTPGTDVARLIRAVEEAGYRPGPIEPVEPVSAARRPNRTRSSQSPDLAIIGSGAAAFAAAIRATELGARVVMIERGTLGGTCVNVGCIPSKALLQAAESYWYGFHPPFAGVPALRGPVDLQDLVTQKRALVDTLRREKYEELIDVYGWEFRPGAAAFVNAQTLQVDGSVIRAGAYLIATGASPAVPPIPGLAERGFLTSTSALDLEVLPESLAVIGANAVGLELGQLFRHLGSRVTLFERVPRIAPFEEPEISAALTAALEAEGIELVPAAEIARVERGPAGRKRLRVVVGGRERTWDVSEILVATGRRPNTAGLGLDRAEVATDRAGAVVVDDTLRTTNARVWAAGDVTAAPQFVYVAAYEGTLAAENILNGVEQRVDFTALPRVTFTHPQIAAVGLTEAEARAKGYEVKTSVLPLSAVPRALVNREPHGLFKLVADAVTDRVLGVHVLAPQAGEVIYAATLAVQFNLTVADLLRTFAPYLTMSEGLKLAAQTFGRDVAKLSCCAG